jgi:hypothetical protein
MVSWFRSQNQAGYDLSIVPQNRWDDEDGAWHVSRSSDLLYVEESQTMVFQSSLKTGEGVAQMVHVTSSQMLYRDQVKDGQVGAIGCIRPCYPYFFIFIVLDPKSILVFYLGL